MPLTQGRAAGRHPVRGEGPAAVCPVARCRIGSRSHRLCVAGAAGPTAGPPAPSSNSAAAAEPAVPAAHAATSLPPVGSEEHGRMVKELLMQKRKALFERYSTSATAAVSPVSAAPAAAAPATVRAPEVPGGLAGNATTPSYADSAAQQTLHSAAASGSSPPQQMPPAAQHPAEVPLHSGGGQATAPPAPPSGSVSGTGLPYASASAAPRTQAPSQPSWPYAPPPQPPRPEGAPASPAGPPPSGAGAAPAASARGAQARASSGLPPPQQLPPHVARAPPVQHHQRPAPPPLSAHPQAPPLGPPLASSPVASAQVSPLPAPEQPPGSAGAHPSRPTSPPPTSPVPPERSGPRSRSPEAAAQPSAQAQPPLHPQPGQPRPLLAQARQASPPQQTRSPSPSSSPPLEQASGAPPRRQPPQRSRSPSPSLELPNLLALPGLSSQRGRGSGKAPKAGPNAVVVPSSRAGSDGGPIVGSTRSAKAEFADPVQLGPRRGPPGSAAGPGGYGKPYKPYSSPYGKESSTAAASGAAPSGTASSGGGAPGTAAAAAASRGAVEAGAGAGSAAAAGPPMSRRAAPSLNPLAASWARGPSHSAAAPPPAAAPTSGPGSAPGGAPMGSSSLHGPGPATAAAAGGSAGSGGSVVTSVESPAVQATAAQSAAPPVPSAQASAPAAAAPPAAAAAKKKPARPKAPWLNSFVQAGLASAGGAASLGVSDADVPSKQPATDLAEVVAAMVREAAARPAKDLSSAIRDLPAPISELQARLEAAVNAEHESELRAVRALYAAGSLRRLQREGIVLVGLEAQPQGRLYRSTLWRFAMPPPPPAAAAASRAAAPPALPYHKFRPGANVIITRHEAESGGGAAAAAGGGGGGKGRGVDAETGLPSDGVEGVVVEAHRDYLVLALEGRAHETFQSMVATAELLQSEEGSGGARAHGGRGVGKGGGGGGGFLGWRLDQSVRDTTTRRHLQGIRRLGMWTESPGDSREGEARVRAVLAGSRSAAVMAAEPPEWVKEGRWREDARVALAAQPGLNHSQRSAVSAALSRTLTLWQGPPGTGKTRTLLALIEILVRVREAGRGPGSRRADSMGPLLAVADTNAAVDNLVEGLAGRGVRVVRLGPAAKARESLRGFSLEAQAEASPAGRAAVAARERAMRRQERARGARNGGGNGGLPLSDLALAAEAAESRTALEAAEAALREAAEGVLAGAQVVVSTCTAAGDSMLDGRPWRCVVVDEASQATEPSVLVALTRGAAFVVMAGDPRQLPPTVLSEAAAQQGLGVTLFERVASTGGVLPLLLDTQYRMHPAISFFPSKYFYGGKLQDGVAAADKPVPQGFKWPRPDEPLALVAVTGGREETSGGIPELAATSVVGDAGGGGGAAVLRPRGGAAGAAAASSASASGSGSGFGDRASYRNQTEALLALAVTQQLLAAGDISSAAILTPYRGQVRLIESLARQRGLEAAWADRGAEVAVSTVDGYQGREADVVVFSAVRANDRGAVGFLSDPRRMNVAITRPRRGLVLLADVNTLTRGSRDWATYVKWAQMQGIDTTDANVIDVEAVLSAAGASGGSGAALLTLSSDDDATDGPSAGAAASVGGRGSGNESGGEAAGKAVGKRRRKAPRDAAAGSGSGAATASDSVDGPGTGAGDDEDGSGSSGGGEGAAGLVLKPRKSAARRAKIAAASGSGSSRG